MAEILNNQTVPVNTVATEPKYAKKPWLAVLLTLLALGLGHLYVGKKKVFGWIMLSVSIISNYLMFAKPDVKVISIYSDTANNIIYNFSIFLVIIAFCFDAYQDAKSTRLN